MYINNEFLFVGITSRREIFNMRTFFEDLGRRIGDTAETMANKAGEAVEVQRLRSQIKSLEYSSEKDYVELGQMTYDKFKAGGILTEQASSICETICSREKRISKYEEQICKIKGSVKCGGCDKAVEKEMAYCPHCGRKVPEEQTSEMTDYTDDAQDVGEKVVDMADQVKEKADSAVDVMGEKAEDVAETAEAMWGKAEEAAETMWGKAEESAETIGEKVDQAADVIKDKSQDIAETIKEKAANTADVVKEKVKEMEERIKSMTEK